MASITMTASFLTGSTMAKQPSTAPRGGLIVAKASTATERVNVEMKNKEESSSGRRDLLFAAAAAAAAAACSIARVAMADEEPKSGTPEAKKKYAPICVTMPTARICRN
ncbi:PHOTOSYSTEM II 5 KDA PROTEIN CHLOROPLASTIC [Salix viminalis]|uniref:PHOTOSYSTEM II 5 kDa PROTEIN CHLOROPLASTIC n=1 Tax=Salix viminalis TaxID=40686 RepID=A0A6N2LCY2_SALVM|nr:PHOTOSYSTEM II 5 KDA PROTEIN CHLOROPLASTIC [Salix viminalis]